MQNDERPGDSVAQQDEQVDDKNNHNLSPFLRWGEGLRPLCEVGEERGAFALEADFFRSAVLVALSRCRSEQADKLDILRAAHDVGGAALRGVDEFGRRIGGEVGEEVKPLADRSASALDLVGQAIRAEVVGEVVGFGEVARQGEANRLFGVLPVVAVVVEVGEGKGFHGGRSFVLMSHYTIFSRVCQPLFATFLRNFLCHFARKIRLF